MYVCRQQAPDGSYSDTPAKNNDQRCSNLCGKFCPVTKSFYIIDNPDEHQYAGCRNIRPDEHVGFCEENNRNKDTEGHRRSADPGDRACVDLARVRDIDYLEP